MTQQIKWKTSFICLISCIFTSMGSLQANTCNSNCLGVEVGAEGLYWTVHQTNLDYAVDFDPTDANLILGKGKTHFIDYDWKGGFRGYVASKWCQWEIKGVFTWYENHAKDSVNTTASNTDLKASLLHPSTGKKNGEKASGDSDLEYRTVDLLVGRDLSFCNCSLILHPFIGVRTLRIDQHLKVDYEGEDFVQPVRVDWSSELNALGLHAGLDMFYRARCGFGLYGTFAGSVLTSRTDIRHLQNTLNSKKKTISTQIDLKEKQNIMIPGYQLSAGIFWDICCGRCYDFRLKLGYELNQWFDTPQLRRYHYNNKGVSSSGTSGNIGIHGATLSAELGF